MWRRAKIIRIIMNRSLAYVLNVDYGGVYLVSFNELRLMRENVMRFAAQALRVKIAGIRPAYGDAGWTAAAKHAVKRYAKQNYYLLCTFIEKLDKIYYSVRLCDTNANKEGIFLHQILVNENHAVYERNSDENSK